MPITAFALTLAISPPTPSDLDGRLRLHLETPVLEYQHHRQWFEEEYQLQFPNDFEDSSHRIRFPAGTGSFALGFGYGVTKGLIVGATVALGVHRRQGMAGPAGVLFPPDTQTSVGVLIRPYLEYAFVPGGRVRPFAFVRGGIGVSRHRTSAGAYESTSHGLSPTLGGGAGVHLFVVPRVSFDLFLAIDHSFSLNKRWDSEDGGDSDFTRSTQVTDLGANLGISVWLGPMPRSRR